MSQERESVMSLGCQNRRQDLVTKILLAYPTARPRIVELAVEALALHAAKNHDYHGDGSGGKFADLGLVGNLHDITRKIGRLHNYIVRGNRAMTAETLKDTALDLAVFALIMAEDLEVDARKKS